MFLYGKNSVFERLKANPRSIKKVFLQDNFQAPHIEKLLQSKRIPVRQVSSQGLYRIKRSDHAQGIVAEIDKFEYASFEDLLEQPKKEKFSFIFLDRIFDPQNLGAIIRAAACMGNFALVIPKHKACEVTEATLHVASGGENFTSVVRISNLTNAILAAKKRGFWIVGGLLEEGQDFTKTTLPFPLCLVLGSEGTGIRYGLKKHLDLKVKIPMLGAPLSLNVATACAIFCYEITKQAHISLSQP